MKYNECNVLTTHYILKEKPQHNPWRKSKSCHFLLAFPSLQHFAL